MKTQASHFRVDGPKRRFSNTMMSYIIYIPVFFFSENRATKTCQSLALIGNLIPLLT